MTRDKTVEQHMHGGRTASDRIPGSDPLPGLASIGCGCDSCGHDHAKAEGTGANGTGVDGTGAVSPSWLGVPRQVWVEGALGVALFVAALLTRSPEWLRIALFLAAWLVLGREVVLGALRGIARGSLFDEFFLMTVASGGAFLIGEHPEAVAVMLFYRIGETLQDAAVDRSKDSIRSLMAIRPDKALCLRNGTYVPIAPEEVVAGDTLLVQPGGRVPVDGNVLQGHVSLDLSALTGESLPVAVEPGMEVLSGSICTNGALTIRAIRPYEDSAVGRILRLVETASSRKARAERFVTRFSRVYTPIVTGAALLLAVLPPLLIPGQSFSTWVYRALVFLVVSCPCALVVSIPLGFYGGIGGAARRGILVKGGQYLEALNHVDTVVFDKTGTLTEGKFQVTELIPSDGKTGAVHQRELLRTAALAERHSTHPLAVSIRDAFGAESSGPEHDKTQEHAGLGVEAWSEGRHLVVGQAALLRTRGISVAEQSDTAHSVHVAADGDYLGEIRLADTPRKGIREAVQSLRGHGIRNIAMLTGDAAHTAQAVADHAGVEEVHAGLMPGQKVERLETMMANGRKAVFVGDGINDAPVLVRADVGIAMGGIGSDAAMEAADIVLMRDDPALVSEAIRIARKTRRIVTQNIVLALGVKGLVLLLGAGGLATMWEAVFADVGVALLAILNATRVLGDKR